MIKKIALLLTLSVTSYAQNIEFRKSFKYLPEELSQIDPRNFKIFNFSLDQTNSRVNVYTSIVFNGTIKSVSSKKPLVLFSGTDYNSKIPYINSIQFGRELEPRRAHGAFLSPYVLEDDKEYIAEFTGFNTGSGFPASKKKDILTLEKLAKEDSGFYSDTKSEFDTKTGYDSELNIKKGDISPITIREELTFVNGNILLKKRREVLDTSSWTSFKGYARLDASSDANHKLADNLNVNIVNKEAGMDMYYPFRNFEFFVFNDNGQLVNNYPVNFDYSRKLQKTLQVFDIEGNKAGLVFVFDEGKILLGKKYDDPIKNRVEVVYMDHSGKLISNVTLRVDSESKSSKKFNPIAAQLLASGEIRLLNRYRVKSQDNYEWMSYSAGSEVFKSVPCFPYQHNATLSNITLEPVINQVIGNKLYQLKYIGQYEIERGNNYATFFYTGVELRTYDLDFNILDRKVLFDQTPSKRRIVADIITANEKNYVLISGDLKGVVVNLVNPSEIHEIKPSKGFNQIEMGIPQNFRFDKAENIVYYLFENRKEAEAEIIAVQL
jgi:hypothetical protein